MEIIINQVKQSEMAAFLFLINLEYYTFFSQQIKYLYEMFKHDKTVKGKIEIVSDLKICRNCDDIITRFQNDFPNIEVVKVWVKKIQR